MPVTQPLPDGPFTPGAGTPGPDMADVVAFLAEKGAVTDAEHQAAIDGKADDGHNHDGDYATLVGGVIPSAQVPSLPASKVTSGTFDAARIPTLAQSKVDGLTADLEAKADAGDLTALEHSAAASDTVLTSDVTTQDITSVTLAPGITYSMQSIVAAHGDTAADLFLELAGPADLVTFVLASGKATGASGNTGGHAMQVMLATSGVAATTNAPFGVIDASAGNPSPVLLTGTVRSAAGGTLTLRARKNLAGGGNVTVLAGATLDIAERR